MSLIAYEVQLLTHSKENSGVGMPFVVTACVQAIDVPVRQKGHQEIAESGSAALGCLPGPIGGRGHSGSAS